MPERSKPARPPKVTLKDVASLAGVDRSVVSRIVNNDPNLNIRPQTRQRVQQTIDKLGYRPNAAARSLRTARAYMFGLLIPDFANPVYAEIIAGAERAAGELGYALMTASSAGVRFALPHYLELIGQGRVDGLLFAGEETGHELEQLRASKIPWVLVNRHTEGSPRYVILDDERAGHLAVDHLVTLGHRRIAHLAGPAGADTAQRRRAGYLSAMAAAQLPTTPGLIAHADYTPAGGAAAMQELLSIPHPPTAVFVANVASAVGVLHAIHERGLSVPHDISVIAVHDMALASHLVPALTTVRMPLEQLGHRALELLAQREPTEPIAEIVTEPVELIVRQSTAQPPNHDNPTAP
ncbi:LacI family DNA-binding transcriptional regulator [Nocardia jiangxiensis]|uniref:LacI family DNA-binding transcriptional regulator n=1 Tax=Nocardia jiangxiensis TaxID=282685 RepID=A0ABW6RX90_9NOCA|nr:LacI family DNA-binding transcriptional regulator [Nocardia jiangxiensis]